MAEITSIEPQAKNKQRCNVYVDGRFYCGIKLEVALKYRLKAGMQIERSRLDEIQLETEKSEALDRAMTHLSATMKTEKQMDDFLASKGYTLAVREYVAERLKYYGLVDDNAYCRAYIGSVHGKGKRAVELDLIKRGARREAVEQALEEFEEDDGEAAGMLEKYMRGKTADRQTLGKAFRYLMSKGYSADTARSALVKYGGADEDN